MPSGKSIKVATRSSPLSIAQTNETISQLKQTLSEHTFEIVPIESEGDRRKTEDLSKLERGVFAKSVELAVLDGRADIAVHSAKDVPAEILGELQIAGYLRRQDPRDVLVHSGYESLRELPKGFKLGTSSQRRACQILRIRPDLQVVPIRGNVDSRISFVETKDVDGVVLAASGILRLGLEEQISSFISTRDCVPDVGQGAILVQCSARNESIFDLLNQALDSKTEIEVTSERSFLSFVSASCKSPVAAHSVLDGDGSLNMIAMAGLPDGSEYYFAEHSSKPNSPDKAGEELALKLAKSGAAHLLGKLIV